MTTSPRLRTARFILAGACLALAACLFDKPKEEVDLTLTRVPAGTERILVKAVDKSDTNIIIVPKLFEGEYTAGKVYHFDLGKVSGRQDNILLRVEGYRGTLMVYMALIHAAKGSSDEILFPDVTNGWPTIAFVTAAKGTDAYTLATVIRGAPEGTRWRLSPNVPQPNQKVFHPTGDGFSLGMTGLIPGTWITAQLVSEDTARLLPVQVPDSMLTDELVSPSGATVEIAGAVPNGENVDLTLNLKNFAIQQEDRPLPGFGEPRVLDARGLKPIPGFNIVKGDISRITGPAWRLGGVTHMVVALHYANGSRVRPLVADTIAVADALRPPELLPKVKIASRESSGTVIFLKFTQTNFEPGMHVHVFQDAVDDVRPYQLCLVDSCAVQPRVHTGAKRLIAIAVNQDHTIHTPQSRDTLNVPW